jgi:hypothetical protein
MITIQSDAVENLGHLFDKFWSAKVGSDLNTASSSSIRSFIFDFFNTEFFRAEYFNLSIDVILSLGLNPKEVVVQPRPTPRVFKPGQHGTSFHCDYWYGHGESFYTIWVPLSDIDVQNTFLFCKEKNEEISENLLKKRAFLELEVSDMLNFEPVQLKSNECFVFSSKLLHGSPINGSKNQRISMDFRIGPISDQTSNKDLGRYLRIHEGKFLHINRCGGFKFMKYVCGGHGKDTVAQQILIEGISREHALEIVGQEAEVERFGHPMLEGYITNGTGGKGFDSLLIASRSVIAEPILDMLSNSKVNIFFALENQLIERTNG